MPYCDEATCTRSCNKFMNLKTGRCLKNECFCENAVEPQRPKPRPNPTPNPDDDWDYIRQDGKCINSTNNSFSLEFFFTI